jgi:hypothetical protein
MFSRTATDILGNALMYALRISIAKFEELFKSDLVGGLGDMWFDEPPVTLIRHHRILPTLTLKGTPAKGDPCKGFY